MMIDWTDMTVYDGMTTWGKDLDEQCKKVRDIYKVLYGNIIEPYSLHYNAVHNRGHIYSGDEK